MKKLSPKNLFALICLSLLSHESFAQFQIKNIRLGGSGCPSETTQIVMAPDLSSASLIFSQFESRVPNLDIGPKVSRNINTLNCNIFLEIDVPNGEQLESLDISYDMRGFVGLDKGVVGSFKSHLVSANGLGVESQIRGPQLLTEKSWSQSFNSQDEDFILNSNKTIKTPSFCGRGNLKDTVSIRLQQNLTTQILNGFEHISQGSITVDTSDFMGSLKIKATTAICRQGGSITNPSSGRNCRIIRNGGKSLKICE